MGASWNPLGGLVLSDKKLSKKEVSHLKREWLAQPSIIKHFLARWWNKLKLVITLFSPLH